jgi:hypothetical protein
MYAVYAVHKIFYGFLCFVDRASRYTNIKKNQLDAQFVFSIFHQTPLHVSGLSKAHHQEVHRMGTTIGTYCFFRLLSVVLAGLEPSQDNRQTDRGVDKIY